MSKSVMQYMSKTMNDSRDSDEDAIRVCVAMDAKVFKAIQEYQARKNEPSQEKEPTSTFSLDDLKKEMMRPMIDDQQIADIEKYASEQLEDLKDKGLDRE